MLVCHTCAQVHDLDQAPDTGECLLCSGRLKDDGEDYPPSLDGPLGELLADTHLTLKSLRKGTKGVQN